MILFFLPSFPIYFISLIILEIGLIIIYDTHLSPVSDNTVTKTIQNARSTITRLSPILIPVILLQFFLKFKKTCCIYRRNGLSKYHVVTKKHCSPCARDALKYTKIKYRPKKTLFNQFDNY